MRLRTIEKIVATIKKDDPETAVTVDPKFEEMADEWLRLNKGTMSDSYYMRATRAITAFKEIWTGVRVKDFTARDIQSFFANLSSKKYKTVTAVLKDGASEVFYNAVKEAGFKKACNSDFSWCSLFTARKGEVIQWNSAEAICKRLKLNAREVFNKIEIEKPYKKETIKGYQRVLSPIFEHAVINNFMDRNYALSKYIKKNIGGKGVDEVEVLSKAELARLIEVLEDNPLSDSIPIMLMMYLGIRKCEMCGLNWNNIDLEKRIISIKQNRIYVPQLGIKAKELKTQKSERDLYIVDGLYKKLVEYKQYFVNISNGDAEFDKSNAVFCNYNGTPRNPGYVDLLLKRFLAEARCHQISPHKLRHTWITTLISNGVAPNIVSKLAGHATVDTTLKIYTHYSKSADNSKDVLERIFSKGNVAEPDWDFA